MTRFFALFIQICRNLALLCALLAPMSVAAEMTISPTRTLISATNPTAIIEVSNPSDRIVDINIDWLDLWATKDGYRVATPAERETLSAAPFLVLSPPTLRLEPGTRGQVTITLRDGLPDLKEERRSHLLFSSNAVRTQLRKTGGLEVDAQLQISTPVILRTRDTTPKVKISTTKLLRNEDGLLSLDITLSAKGNSSAIGMLTVEQPDTKPITIDNLAIYTDEGKRRVVVPLGKSALERSSITVLYSGIAEQNGALLATKKFSVTPAN